MDATSAAARSRLEELRELIEKVSIQRGDFVLASGARSTYYFNSKATVLSPRGAALVGEAMFDVLVPCGAEAVGGLAMGATFIATAVALVSGQKGRPIFAFNVRPGRKGHGLENAIDESYHPDGKALLCPGRRVAVVDDVVTSAGSVLKAVDAVLERGCAIVRVLAIVDRGAGGGDRLRERGLPYVPLFCADSHGNLSIGLDVSPA